MNDLNLDWSKLASEIYIFLKGELKDLWKEVDEEFLTKIADDIAREKTLAETEQDSEEHIQNLKHLIATLEAEIVRRRIRLNRKGKKFFVKVIELVIKTLIIALINKKSKG